MGASPMPALERERATFEARRHELLDHEGQYVIVHEDQIDGFWDTYEAALKEAYAKYGLDPFMVKQVHAAEPILHFARDVSSCPS